MNKLTPMMEQYFSIKSEYKDCILFYRLGDFYEMFFDDAKIVSEELDLTLTGRDCGQNERAPMCGVPFHSVDSYLSKLVQKGYKVAICEQVEDPKKAKTIVKRDVIRVVSRGTIIDEAFLEKSKNNYIMCIYQCHKGFGLAFADVTTGEFLTTKFYDLEIKKVIDEIFKFEPAEIIVNGDFEYKEIIESTLNIKPQVYYDWSFEYNTSYKILCDHFNVLSLKGFGINEDILSVSACGALIKYLHSTQKNSLSHIISIKNYSVSQYMVLDMPSRKNLELCESIKDGSKKGSLLSVLDKTKTAMGGRLLRNWIEQPLINYNDINIRLNAVEEFISDVILREDLKDLLSNIKDLERILSKVTYKTINARELNFLKNSIKVIPDIKNLLQNLTSNLNKELYENLDPLEDIYSLIDSSIKEDVPISLREGGLIKEGYDQTIDKYNEAKENGSLWIKNLEEKEKEKTGIKNLRIKYNKVIGYYIEVTNSYKKLVPDSYLRRQTLTNAERYVIPELKEIEETILNATEKIVELEYEAFTNVRNLISLEIKRIQTVANIIAKLDVLQSLAEVADKNNYIKPVVNNSDIIDIKDGRHPVVELSTKYDFVSNDTFLNCEGNRVSIITGPNMAGKSTYMRQTALIVLMAQIGSFVPASHANIGVVDRIFTRVGASDDLATGQSTFMVEMNEVANILNNATSNSLLILDEIGRGTSTYDGLSIAWSVLEYIADKNKIGAKTLFATHYHELTEIEGKVDGVVNYCIKVEEIDNNVVFLRKIVKGSIDKSYGIHVASLAGLPKDVIYRSNEIMENLVQLDSEKIKNIENTDFTHRQNIDNNYLKLIEEIKNLNLECLRPIDALTELANLQDKIKKNNR